MLSIETEHWHGVLQGLADGFRDSAEVQVVKIARPESLNGDALSKLRLDGIITRVASRADETHLLETGIPAVNVSGRFRSTKCDNVFNDDDRVGQMAAAFFQRRGFTSFGFCGVEKHRSSRLRQRGFVSTVEAAGFEASTLVLPDLPEGDAPSLHAVEELAEWLRTLAKPAAVFGFNDALARAVAEACSETKLEIPSDVAVLGVDNDDIQLGFSAVALSSIELNRRRIGQFAARLMLERLADATLEPRFQTVPPLKIVARGSTDKLAVNDSVVAEALDYITENLANPIYVEDIAREVGVSRRSLEVRFKAALQTSVYAEVQRQQLERARILLIETPKMTIAEVAYACGFQDARHLNVVCRKKLDCTPGSLRKG
ncbi:MAG: DNA-binding transcriptional regulator [Synoicihabitans sp.]